MATILDGKALAEQCKQEVKKAAETLARRPGLAVIIVGNNPASRVYVNSKRKDCEECGFFSEEYALPEETTQGVVTADMVKPGAVVIDVAMNRNQAGKLCGDVDYPAVKEIVSAITPVPGGVGPMTRAMLMKNTLLAAQKHQA